MFPLHRDRALAAGRPGRLSAALSRAIAFVTLEAYGTEGAATGPDRPTHPHRRAAELPRRSRRPGALAPRAHVCRAPVERPRPPRRTHAPR